MERRSRAEQSRAESGVAPRRPAAPPRSRFKRSRAEPRSSLDARRCASTPAGRGGRSASIGGVKGLIARLLRDRSAWQLVLIAGLSTALGLGIVYGVRSSTLRMMKLPLIVLFGIAGAGLLIAFVRRDAEIKDPSRPAQGWGRFLAGIAGLAALIAFVTYSFGHYRRQAISTCNGALLPTTKEARRAALAEAERTLASPFALLPELWSGGRAAAQCERSQRDFARAEQGLCPRYPMTDVPCTCGEESYPYERCSEPTCLYGEVSKERFDCPGDPITDDLGNF